LTPVLVFDIETVPDAEGIRRLLSFGPELNDAGVVEFAMQRRRQASGNDFLPPHMHRVIAISCALRSDDGVRVWSLGSAADSERDIVQRFFDGIEKYTPQLVSWNGSGFDLPVLHYRALKHGIAAPKYWQLDGEAKWDNYIGRYGFRHTDLMDVLALYNGRNFAPLHEMAVLLGLPGKLGMDGSQVAAAFAAGKLAEIRAYCETDVLNTWLIYLRFLLMRGQLSAAEHQAELDRAREFLAQSKATHWREFLAAWKG